MKRLGLFLLALTLFVGAQAAEKVNMDSLKNAIIANSKEIQEQKKDSMMLSKLSPNQLVEIKKQELENQRQEIEKNARTEMPLNGLGVVVICLLPFLFAGTIIVVNVKAKKEESKRKYDLYSKSLEMGQTIPEHFFDEPKKANPASNLKRGIIWLAVGLAVLVSFLVMHKQNALILGIVPAFIGAGYLLVHLLDKPKSDTTAE